MAQQAAANCLAAAWIAVMPEKICRNSWAEGQRTQRPTRLPTAGAAAAKTPITSDPRDCLTSTEQPAVSPIGPGPRVLSSTLCCVKELVEGT